MPKDEYEGPERRQFRRLKKPFSLRLQVQSGGAFADWDIVLVKDISRLGLSFTYDKSLKKGMVLNLKINFGLERGTIQCTGKVTRIQEPDKTKAHKIGVAFSNISESDGELIDQAAVEFYAQQALDNERSRPV